MGNNSTQPWTESEAGLARPDFDSYVKPVFSSGDQPWFIDQGFLPPSGWTGFNKTGYNYTMNTPIGYTNYYDDIY